MAYDYPYRLERNGRNGNEVEWAIMRTGEGVLCVGTNFDEMRHIVDAVNEVERQGKEHLGR